MSENKIFDPHALDQYQSILKEEANEFIVDIIDTFITNSEEVMNKLYQSITEQDTAIFTRAAHSLKSGCATVGGTSLAKQLQTLEDMDIIKNRDEADQLLKEIAVAFPILIKILTDKKEELD